MTSRHLVDPELLPGLDVFPAFDFGPETLEVLRQQMEALASAGQGVLDPGIGQAKAASHDGYQVPLLIHKPPASGAPCPAVLYMHGGGYIIGSALMMQAQNQQLALDSGCVVVSVDYRLAPDFHHPAPIEDCYGALKWLHANAAALGVDATRIAVYGESAGAGLAASLALLARDRGEITLAHQHLIYPMLDDRTCIADRNSWAGEFLWTRTSNCFGWSSLLGQAPGSAGVSPYAAAARAEDLAGLPNAYIAVGALDLFAEEDITYAQRLMRAGVPTELHVYAGAYHGFDMVPTAQVARNAQAQSLAALKRALGTAA